MKYIEFKGKKIVFEQKKSINWITIRSVCEAIGVNYNRQFQNIKEDPILRSAFAKQQMQVPGDNQKREVLCLPEKYVYGWIFSIKSESPELLVYKEECYHVLANHFKGIIKSQTELYTEIAKERRKIQQCEKVLADNPEYQEYINSKMRVARLWKNVREATNDPELFDQIEND